MLHSKQKFQELVKQTKALQKDEKGQLKGGFSSFSLGVNPKELAETNDRCNDSCTVSNNCSSSIGSSPSKL